MNYQITADTHLGHNNLMKYTGRPQGFEELILKRHMSMIRPADILIHLGDVCIGDEVAWHSRLMEIKCFKKWLVKGNHDRKSNTWYLSHGWDFVADAIKIRQYGLDILLSHIPQPITGFDINVHGHCHNKERYNDDPELTDSIKTDKHRLVMLEHDYKPQTLRRIVGK